MRKSPVPCSRFAWLLRRHCLNAPWRKYTTSVMKHSGSLPQLKRKQFAKSLPTGSYLPRKLYTSWKRSVRIARIIHRTLSILLRKFRGGEIHKTLVIGYNGEPESDIGLTLADAYPDDPAACDAGVEGRFDGRPRPLLYRFSYDAAGVEGKSWHENRYLAGEEVLAELRHRHAALAAVTMPPLSMALQGRLPGKGVAVARKDKTLTKDGCSPRLKKSLD